MEIPGLQNIGRGGLPDVKRQPGSSCFKSGSWKFNDLIEFGYRLKSRALRWENYPGAERTTRSSAIKRRRVQSKLKFQSVRSERQCKSKLYDERFAWEHIIHFFLIVRAKVMALERWGQHCILSKFDPSWPM